MKGQMSFDLIFALLFAMILISSITMITQNISEQQHDNTIKTQLKKISLEVARIILLTKTIEQYDDYEIQYYIPKIIEPGKRTPLDCEIKINQTQVTVTSGTINETTPIKLDTNPNLTFNCGEKMRLSK